MIDKKILVVSIYPIENPLHGGQKRVKALYEHYRGFFKEARFVAVFYKKFYGDFAPTDIEITDPKTIRKIDSDPFAGDLTSGKAIYTDPVAKAAMTKLLLDYQPDVIEVEHIYPYAGLKPLLDELGLKPKLILSSHNIEYEMKQNIFKEIGTSKTKTHKLLEHIKSLETSVSRQSDVVIAVSRKDARRHKQLGAKKVIVIQNGISKVNPSEEAISHWHKFKTEKKLQNLVTFVGSAHPPNLFGFEKTVGTDLSFLPEGSAITLAGGIAYMMEEEMAKRGQAAFWNRAIALGRLSDDLLAGLIDQSEVLLLPILGGGGSNLKTAEAILSGQKIVATDFAFRAFEKYQKLPNIFIADTPADFRNKIIEALSATYQKRTKSQEKLAEQVEWSQIMAPLGHKLEAAIYGYPVYIGRRLIRIAKIQISNLSKVLRNFL